MYLFFGSVVVFLILGTLVAFYVARLLVRPLFQMQQAMDKIAQLAIHFRSPARNPAPRSSLPFSGPSTG